MKRLNHAIDWIILGLCICGYCIELSNPSLTWEIFLGILAALYCTYSIVVLLALPIKFDWILANAERLNVKAVVSLGDIVEYKLCASCALHPHVWHLLKRQQLRV